MNNKIKFAAKWAFALALFGALFVSLTIAYVQFIKLGLIKNAVSGLEVAPYIIVLGASVKQDGAPSDALYDRIAAGIEAYKARKGERLLMTGDDGAFHVNEVATMERLAKEQGVPDTDLVVDGQGYRTYESCKRAKEVFGIEKAIVVTQRFHLPRALYLCDALGLKVQGLPADRQAYKKIIYFTIRDLLASFKAWWDVNILPPQSPVSLGQGTFSKKV